MGWGKTAEKMKGFSGSWVTWQKVRALFLKDFSQKYEEALSYFNLPQWDKDASKNHKLLKEPKLLLANNLHLWKYGALLAENKSVWNIVKMHKYESHFRDLEPKARAK